MCMFVLCHGTRDCAAKQYDLEAVDWLNVQCFLNDKRRRPIGKVACSIRNETSDWWIPCSGTAHVC